jgi:hypothetical protein
MSLFQYLKLTFQSRHLFRNMLIGALPPLSLIIVFLSVANDPDPAWHPLWILRPLLFAPFAGAMGGLFFTFMEPWRIKSGWTKIGAYLACLFVYLIGSHMGFILGLDGTYWD